MHSSLWGNQVHPEIMECPPLDEIGQKADERRDPRVLTKTIYTIARILLGIQFGILGFNGFVPLPFLPVPSYIPPTALAFAGAMATSHFAWFVFGAQVIAGLLVLFNRLVLFALVVLGAVLANVFAFHITMWPQLIFPMPIVALVLWFLTAWPHRARFAPLFAWKVEAA